MSDTPLSPEEIERRKPVWLALSDLWLDTELTDSNINYIATVMVDSGYSLSELRVICDSEIAPIVYKNLLSVAGVWSGFDPHWLFEQIIAEMNKPNRWQDALLDPIRRVFMQTNHLTESEWPLLIMKYREIKRSRQMIEL